MVVSYVRVFAEETHERSFILVRFVRKFIYGL